MSFIRYFAVTIILLFIASFAQSASFDCQKASTQVEKNICSNEVLSKLDEEMAKAYRDALDSLSSEGQKETKEYQKKWLKSISKLDKKNLKLNYEARIKELQECLIKFPGRTFRKVYLDYHCECLEGSLTYPQIEPPRDENEKYFNDMILKKAKSHFEDYECSKDSGCEYDNDQDDVSITISFNSKKLITYTIDSDGTANHRSTNSMIFSNWLLESRKELKTSDLFDDSASFHKKLKTLLLKKKQEWDAEATGMTLLEPDVDAILSESHFMISKEGLGFGLALRNFRQTTFVKIDWKLLDPYLSKNGRSLISEQTEQKK